MLELGLPGDEGHPGFFSLFVEDDPAARRV
jgi:hypothetical protein